MDKVDIKTEPNETLRQSETVEPPEATSTPLYKPTAFVTERKAKQVADNIETRSNASQVSRALSRTSSAVQREAAAKKG